MWYTSIAVVIAKMEVLRHKVDTSIGFGELLFDAQAVTSLAFAVVNLPEDLSAWMYEIFEEPLQHLQNTHKNADCGYYIQQVRDATTELSTGFLQHEIQAIWACFYNDKNFMPLDVFYDHEEIPYTVNEVLERWTPLKIATVYYVGILSTKYADLNFTSDNVMSLFVASKTSEPNDYATFEGSLLPSFDYITTLATTHRTNVSQPSEAITSFTAVSYTHLTLPTNREV